MALARKKKNKKEELPAEVTAEAAENAEDADTEEEEDGKGKKKKKKKEGSDKPKLEISDEIKRLIFIMGGVILLIFAYFFGYQSISDQNTLLESSVTRLQSELATLREMEANKEANLQEIDNMKKEISAIVAKYPADVKEEDIMFFIDKLEIAETVSGLSTSFTPKQMVLGGQEQAADAAATEAAADGTAADTAAADATAQTNTATGNYVLYNTISSLSFTAGYNDTKTVIERILGSEDQMSIGQIDLSFDEGTGNLNGTVNVNNYSMTGTGKEYTETPIEQMPTGRTDLFGTINVTENQAGPTPDQTAETVGE